jgi:serine/threonine protein kinase
MDYAPHGTLRTRHPRNTQVPLDTVVRYVKQIASALQYAHEEHLIHRDVKPENILIGPQQELLLSDFGVSTVYQTGRTSLQQASGIAGTPYYMAPEQFRGKPQPASDQYALAIVAYEWLTGTPPFTEGNFIQIGYQHNFEPPPPLRNRVPITLEAVEQVITQALVKDPQQRFRSIQEFADALEQASSPKKSPIIRETPISKPAPSLIMRPRQERSPIIKQVRTNAIPMGTTLLTYKGHTHNVRSIVWSPDGMRIASGSWDKTVQVWEAAGGQLLQTFKGHNDWVYSVAWSPNGTRIASSSRDQTVQIQDATSGRLVCTYKRHNDLVRSVAWSPDSTRIASSSDDRTVQKWDATDGRILLTFQGHTNWVFSVAWSPDSTYIASGSRDNTVRVWEAASGRLFQTYKGHTDRVLSVAWSPDSTHIASGSADKTM